MNNSQFHPMPMRSELLSRTAPKPVDVKTQRLKLKVKQMEENGKIWVFLPIVVYPSTTTWDLTTTPSCNVTWGPIIENGPTSQVSWIVALGSIMADGCIELIYSCLNQHIAALNSHFITGCCK